MKTPFCTAVKLAHRSVEEIRSRIGEAQEELVALEGRAATLRAVIATERACAASSTRLPQTRWFGKAAADQRGIADRQAWLQSELVVMQAEASTRLASSRALEEAVARHRADRLRALARREQGAADDRAATVFRTRARSRGAGGAE